jgi:xylulokinase
VKPLLAGLDLGTSGLKAGLFTPDGERLRLERVPYPLYAPRPGWAEQEPADWWAAAVRGLRALTEAATAAGGEIVALGLAGQCPGHVLLGRDGAALGRAMIWRDQRATAEAAWLGDHLAPADVRRWTGLDNLAEPTLPPARLLWLRTHRSDDWQRTRAILQPKDYVAFQLTGVVATDLNSAYCLAHPRTARYDPDYLAALGVSPDVLPPVYPPQALAGQVTPVAGKATGLAAGTPVIIGTIDAFCDLLGSGAVEPGQAIDVAGTSEIVALVTDGPAGGDGVFPADLGGEIHFLCGPTQAGGDALQWLARGFFPDKDPATALAALEAAAGGRPPGSAGLIFLPYLEGERAPIWDTSARGAVIGLTLAHGRRDCARAVFEGVAFAVRHVLERCEAGSGRAAQQVTVCGGGAQSDFWNQLKADVLDRPVVATSAEAACLGAAALASAGLGLHAGLAAAAQALVRPRRSYQPQAEAAARYAEAYGIYLELYPALRPSFSRLARLAAA